MCPSLLYGRKDTKLLPIPPAKEEDIELLSIPPVYEREVELLSIALAREGDIAFLCTSPVGGIMDLDVLALPPSRWGGHLSSWG